MKHIILVYLTLFSLSVFAQSKYDYTWVLGYGAIFYDTSGLVIGGNVIDFKSTPYVLELKNIPTQDVTAGISDKNGNLIAFTDGCKVANGKYETMLNGDSLNPGVVYNQYCHGIFYPNF
jgi:hypothetical protein